MNVFHRANDGRFFYLAALRIICIEGAFFGGYVKSCFCWLGGKFRGGLGYWRGRVLAGGVDKQGLTGVDFEQRGGADGGAVRQAAAGAGLVEGLPTDTQRGGATGGNREGGNKSVKKVFHGVRLYKGGALVQRRGVRQVVVGVFRAGQSVLFMTTKAGR